MGMKARVHCLLIAAILTAPLRAAAGGAITQARAVSNDSSSFDGGHARSEEALHCIATPLRSLRLQLPCLPFPATRLGPEFHDLDDVRYLLRHLDVQSAHEALEIVKSYFDEEQIPMKTRLALEEVLGSGHA